MMYSQAMLKSKVLTLSAIMLLTIFAGCSHPLDLDEDTAPDDQASKDAMGLYWPTIDGVIHNDVILPPCMLACYTEWSDSVSEDIYSYSYFFGKKLGNGQSAVTNYKSVDDGFAFAIEVPNLENTPNWIEISIGSDRLIQHFTDESDTYNTEIIEDCLDYSQFDLTADCVSGAQSFSNDFEDPIKQFTETPLSQSNAKNYYNAWGDDNFIYDMASVYDKDSKQLAIEVKAEGILAVKTKVKYGLNIGFMPDESGIYPKNMFFEKNIDFEWILTWTELPRSDFRVTNIEVTQAIQTADMQMRLVKEKSSMARVYVDYGDIETGTRWLTGVPVTVSLKACVFIFCSPEMTTSHTVTSSSTTPIGTGSVCRATITCTANFLLPNEWVSHDLILLVATVRPDFGTTMDYVDPDKSNNYYADIFWFNHTRDFVVWMAQIGQDADGDGTLDFRALNNFNQWMAQTENLLPVSDLIQVNLPTAPICPTTTAAGAPFTHSACNQAIHNWFVSNNCIFWFGLCLPNTGALPFPDQIFGLTPPGATFTKWSTPPPAPATVIPEGIGGTSTPAWWGGSSAYTLPSLVSMCRGAGGINCPVHEITHNIGPRCMDNNGDGDCIDLVDEAWGMHLSTTGCGALTANCPVPDPCGAGGQDLMWNANFAPFNIKDIGWNSLTLNPNSNQAALVPAGYPDYMSYCSASTNAGALFPVSYQSTSFGGAIGTWTSTPRWEWMYDKFLNWVDFDPDAPYNGARSSTASSESNSTFRLISGVVREDGSEATFDHSWTIPGTFPDTYAQYGEQLEDPDYAIVIRDVDGTEIQKIRMQSSFESIEGNNTDFYFSHVVQDNGLIDSVELLHNGSMVDTLSSTGMPITQMHSLGTEYTREQPADLSWDPANSSSEHEVMYQLDYSWGADKWLTIGSPTNDTSNVLDFGTLPSGDDAKFRVRASNGFDTYYSESTAFSLPNQAPILTLETSGALGFNSSNHVSVTQGDAFSIKPSVSDDDWQSLNENGFSAVLKRDDETVWADGGDNNWRAPNRVTSHDTLKAIINNLRVINFPNSDILPGEMTPGEYQFEMTYVDEAGASVTETVSFEIVEPNYPTQELLDNYRRDLVSPESDVDLNINELRYYVELERIARDEEDALTDSELNNLRILLGISEARAAELEQMRLDNSLRDLDLDLDDSNGDNNTLGDG